VDSLAERLGHLDEGQGLVWGLTPSLSHTLRPLRFGTGPQVFPRMDRIHHHLEGRVAPSKQFYFHHAGGVGLPAGNLRELIERVRAVDPDAIAFHSQRGDFARWIRDVLHDQTLARWLDRLRGAELSGAALRRAVLDALELRLRHLERLVQRGAD
jgi:hypothetical protein